jgi:hypothetical protein
MQQKLLAYGSKHCQSERKLSEIHFLRRRYPREVTPLRYERLAGPSNFESARASLMTGASIVDTEADKNTRRENKLLTLEKDVGYYAVR